MIENIVNMSLIKLDQQLVEHLRAFKIELQSGRDSGNDFDRFSVPFLEGRISDIQVACKYPIRNANFKSCFSDIQQKFVLFLSYLYLCHY